MFPALTGSADCCVYLLLEIKWFGPWLCNHNPHEQLYIWWAPHLSWTHIWTWDLLNKKVIVFRNLVQTILFYYSILFCTCSNLELALRQVDFLLRNFKNAGEFSGNLLSFSPSCCSFFSLSLLFLSLAPLPCLLSLSFTLPFSPSQHVKHQQSCTVDS